MKLTKLLIADDERETSHVIRHMIPWAQYVITLCTEATNGKEAIDIIHREHPDIALLDIRMPVIDGLGIIRHIHEQNLNIQVIILSGYDEFVYAQTALRYGVSDYLLKPCRMEDLLSSILKCKEQLAQAGIPPVFSDLQMPSDGTDTLDSNSLFYLDAQKKKLLEAIRTGETDSTAQLLQKLFLSFTEKSVTERGIIHYLLALILDIARLCRECSIPLPPQMHTLMDFNQLTEFSSLQCLETALKGIVLDIADKISEKAGKSIPVYGAIRYIKEHYGENLDLNLLSRQVHVTPAYLSLLFKMQTGINFLEFLTNYRIEKACELLKTTSLKTYEIAYRTGFKDEKYFSTVFKKQMGMPPSKYRKIHF